MDKIPYVALALLSGGLLGALVGYVVGRGTGEETTERRWRERVTAHQAWGADGWNRWRRCLAEHLAGEERDRAVAAAAEAMVNTRPAFCPPSSGGRA